MKRLTLVILTLMIPVGLEAQYRNPVFLSGGAPVWASTLGAPNGIWLVDGKKRRCTSLFPPTWATGKIYEAKMDVDNRHIVCSMYHSTSSSVNICNGLFRFDPQTKTLQTIVMNHHPNDGPMYYRYRMLINQDGDYVFGANGRTTTPTGIVYDAHILKFDASSTLTTVFRHQMLGPNDPAYFHGAIGRDIDTGDYLINTGRGSISPNSKLGVLPWIRIDPHGQGTWSTFAAGTYPSYGGRDVFWGNLHQDYATGEIQEVYRERVYVSKRGGSGFTTLWVWGAPAGVVLEYPGCRDLQSAPRRRWIAPGWREKRLSPTRTTLKPWYVVMRESPFSEFGVDCDPTNALDHMKSGPTVYTWMWDFYQRRNIQTVKTSPDRWQVRFSCPNFPGKPYLAAVGASGIRPGVPLASGRRIWINPDPLVALSLSGRLVPFFRAGPGILDHRGEAQGALDSSRVAPTRGTTVWIAMIVLDPAAPDGIAFIPDTYVMKLP